MRNTVNALLGHIQTGFVLMGNGLKEAIATEARDNATFAKRLSIELESFERCGFTRVTGEFNVLSSHSSATMTFVILTNPSTHSTMKRSISMLPPSPQI
jgi:hypothetical protein